MASGTSNNLYGVWGSSGTDVFVLSSEREITFGQTPDIPLGRHIILHYDGSSWSPMNGVTTYALNAVWGSSADDIFVVGGYPAYTTCPCNSLECHFGGCIITYGPTQLIKHFNGTNWNATTSINPELYSVWGSAGSDVFAAGDDGTILHYNGTKWSPMSSGTTYTLCGVWGSSGSDVFAVGSSGSSGTILHYDGSSWSAMASGTIEPLYAVWGSSSNDVFSVGASGTILHYGSGECPAKTVLGESNYDIYYKLRALRKEMLIKTKVGIHYTSLYYKHGPELSAIFTNNDELKEKANILIQRILMPLTETLLAKKEITINENTVQKAMELIDGLKSRASPLLEKDLANLKHDILNGIILKPLR